MRTICLMVCFALLLTLESRGQSVDNIRASVVGEQVIVNYDLITSQQGQKFEVELYSSVNGYKSPLKSVTGDVGNNILPGKKKRIIWSPNEELERFEGDVTFEVRAVVIIPPVVFRNPTDGTAFKRGRIYQIKWDGLNTNNKVDLQLIRNGVKTNTIGSVNGSSDYTWVVPEDSKPGSDYQIKLVLSNNQKTASSPVFKINRKIPLALKVAPVVVIGALVGILSSGGGGGESDSPPPDEPLPEPPDPGN